jgi:hypothetical protein
MFYDQKQKGPTREYELHDIDEIPEMESQDFLGKSNKQKIEILTDDIYKTGLINPN